MSEDIGTDKNIEWPINKYMSIVCLVIYFTIILPSASIGILILGLLLDSGTYHGLLNDIIELSSLMLKHPPHEQASQGYRWLIYIICMSGIMVMIYPGFPNSVSWISRKDGKQGSNKNG